LGQSGKTLLRVQIPEEAATIDGLDTLWRLKSSAVSNRTQREEKAGRKIFPEDSDFLVDI